MSTAVNVYFEQMQNSKTESCSHGRRKNIFLWGKKSFNVWRWKFWLRCTGWVVVEAWICPYTRWRRCVNTGLSRHSQKSAPSSIPVGFCIRFSMLNVNHLKIFTWKSQIHHEFPRECIDHPATERLITKLNRIQIYFTISIQTADIKDLIISIDIQR